MIKTNERKVIFLFLVFLLNLVLAFPNSRNFIVKTLGAIERKSHEKIEKSIDRFNSYQFDSEALVYGRIIGDRLGIKNSNFLLMIEKDKSNNLEELKINRLNHLYSSKKMNEIDLDMFKSEWKIKEYFQQFGLQGNFFSFIINKLGITDIKYLYFINIFITGILIVYILNWVYLEFGKVGMYVSSLNFLFFSRFIKIERNLYWVFWTCILPFFLSLYIAKNKKNIKYLFLFPFFSILLKCLNGYEYISTVLINMEIPIIYYGIKNKEKIKKILYKCFIIGISGITGFLISIFLHMNRLIKFSGSITDAINLFLLPIRYRTNFLENSEIIKNATDELMKISLESSIMEVLSRYLFDSKMLIIEILLIIFFILDLKNKKNREIIILILLSFLGVLSWLVLASGHSYIHTSINTVLWNIPFLIFSFAYIGMKLEEFLKKSLIFLRKSKR